MAGRASSSTVEVTAQTSPVRRGFWYYASAWLPVLLCIAVIATESTVYFGADHTSSPLRRLVEFFFGKLNGNQWWYWHIRIRKCGHFLGYGLLSIAWFRAFWMSLRLAGNPNSRRLTLHGLAMLGTLVIASSDELHQLFLPNRSGSIIDVMVDCSGGLLMQALIWWVMRRRQFSN